MVKEEHLLRLVGLIPGAFLQKISGCSHLSILSSPQAIAVIRGWLLEGD